MAIEITVMVTVLVSCCFLASISALHQSVEINSRLFGRVLFYPCSFGSWIVFRGGYWLTRVRDQEERVSKLDSEEMGY